MRILIDADSCPHIRNTEDIAAHFNIQCIAIYNLANEVILTYAEPVLVSVRPDSADVEINRLVANGDIVVTSDKELTQQCLKKGAIVFNLVGKVYPASVMQTLIGIKCTDFFRDPANTFSEHLKRLKYGYSKMQHDKRVFSARLIIYLRNLQNSTSEEKNLRL